MKLAKTRLRNQLSQVNLENLLFIATETPKTGFTDSDNDFFVDELRRKIIIGESAFEALIYLYLITRHHVLCYIKLR